METRIFSVAAVIALSTCWLLSATAEPTAAAIQTPTPVVAMAPQEPAVPASAKVMPTAPAAPTPVADRSHLLELPDGSSMPTLNGAVDAAPLATYWGPFPWSPIVATERSDAGLDWYRHADGSYSTTQMVWRSDLGRMAAMTRVAHPGPTPATTAPAR